MRHLAYYMDKNSIIVLKGNCPISWKRNHLYYA